jgi:hypothetical protein
MGSVPGRYNRRSSFAEWYIAIWTDRRVYRQSFVAHCRFAKGKKKAKERDVLFVHEGRDLTVCLLSAFEQFVSREAEQDLGVDRVRAHEGLAVGQRLGQLVDLTLAEGRVRARSARGARQAQEV